MGGFLRGLILGMLLSGIAFSAAAIVFPRDGKTMVTILEKKMPASTPDVKVAAITPAKPDPVKPVTPPVQQSQGLVITAPSESTGGPVGSGPLTIGSGLQLGAPDVSGGSGGATLGTTTDSSPTRPSLGSTQVAIATPALSSGPSVDTASTDKPTVTDIGNGDNAEESDSLYRTLVAKPLVAGNALKQNAVEFKGSKDKPLMAIILQDDGAAENLRRGLLTLSAPITFGVTANLDSAENIGKNYASKGYEVVAVLPGSNQVVQRGMSEIEVQELLSGVFDAVPMATTLVDRIGGDLPRDPGLVKASLATLSITGHGLLTHRGSGLNNVPQQAGANGISSDLVFRIIDEAPDPAAIRQALDRAVLEASKSGKVIVIGRVQPDTVTTLFSWLLSPSASSVSIAPVSQVLTGVDP